MALVHASPESLWRSPAADASDAELKQAFSSLDRELVVFGHIHWPFVRRVGDRTFANSGSAGLPYDGDPRAAYLLIDNGKPEIRRVEYDIDREIQMLERSGLPHADWIIRTIRGGSPQMP
jgi:diadenosine tetraphosphatase ApaH/serine/threonine PP2A family protein phosphatase